MDIPRDDPETERMGRLRHAQRLCRDALHMEADDGVRVARRALMLSDGCPEARLLLAVDAEDRQDSRRLLERALLDAEELVGEALGLPAPKGERIEGLERGGVDLLGVEDGPTYLQVRKTLGFCLARLGDEAGALHHLGGVAFLDPTDGMGVGHTLLVSFLVRGEEGDDELAREIASAQVCGCPYHLYSRALLSYRLRPGGRNEGPEAHERSQGESQGEAGGLLREALVANPWVPLYLLGRRGLPDDPPTAEEVLADGRLSGETAAGAYASVALVPWHETPGAIGWLEEVLAALLHDIALEN